MTRQYEEPARSFEEQLAKVRWMARELATTIKGPTEAQAMLLVALVLRLDSFVAPSITAVEAGLQLREPLK